ncbi:MAG: ABC transporter permease [Acidipropionibacterium acidipropionici]|uniref:ABC transporter permease n=1 Tax=Acidipropionibacterium acidipropionici TaxID=1748 RepID=UPI002F3562E7
MTPLRRLLRSLAELIISLLVASLIVYGLLNLLPGDVAQVMLGTNADPAAAAKLRNQLGLDRPFLVRYGDWMTGLLTGNLGSSVVSGEAIGPEIASRLAVTGWLVGLAMLLAVLACLPTGIYAAVHRRRARGFAVSAASQILMSVPAFLAGILLILLFSVTLGWLPAGSYVPLTHHPADWLRHIILPGCALALVQAAVLSRYVRSAFIDVLADDHLRTARAVGWRLWPALIRHGLRNASISLVTVLGLQLSTLLVGAIVVEQVFVIPGLGSYLLDAVSMRDLVVVSDVVMVLVALVLLITFLVDLLVVLIDPRLRVTADVEEDQ